MTVHTASYLRRVHQPQERRAAAARQRAERVNEVLGAMERDAILHRCHEAGRITWTLSGTGQRLAYETVVDVLASKHVVGVSDGLFGREISQTFRWCDDF